MFGGGVQFGLRSAPARGMLIRTQVRTVDDREGGKVFGSGIKEHLSL